MPGGRYPWAVRAGGPLLGQSEASAAFRWKSENAQNLPLGDFTRGNTASVLTTTDGISVWLQQTRGDEILFDGLRREATEFTTNDMTSFDIGSNTTVTPDVSNDRGEPSFRVQMTASGTGTNVIQNVTFAGNACWITARVKLAPGSVSPTFKFFVDGSTQSELLTATSDWQTFGVYVPSTSAIFAASGIDNDGATATDILVSEIHCSVTQVGASSSPPDYVNPLVVYNASGDVTGVGAGVRYYATANGNFLGAGNVVAFGTGATITGGGFLPQNEGFNQILQSNDLTQAPWTVQGAAATADLGITDIGGNATRVSGLGAQGVDDIVQTATGFSSNVIIAPSFWIRAVSTSGELRIIQGTSGSSRGEWSLDLSQIGSNWVRIEPGTLTPGFTELVAWTADPAGSAGIKFYAQSGGPLSIDLSFVNQERSPFASSPIVTTTFAGQRSPDTLLLPGILPEAYSGSIDVTYPLVTGSGAGDDDPMLQFGVGSADRLTSYANGVQLERIIFTAAGVLIAFVDPTAGGTREKLAFTMELNNAILAIEGKSPIPPDTSTGVIPIGDMFIGRGNNRRFRGRMHEVVIF